MPSIFHSHSKSMNNNFFTFQLLLFFYCVLLLIRWDLEKYCSVPSPILGMCLLLT